MNTFGYSSISNVNPALKDKSMGGRFGKYGDIKRKARLRRSRELKRDVRRFKQKYRRLKKNKEPFLQSPGKLEVDVEFKP